MWSDEFKSTVPAGKYGSAEVEKHVTDEHEARMDRLHAIVSGSGRFVPEGTYTGLKINGHLIMSDTPDEIHDHLGFIRSAHGNVLIGGLGLGVVAVACAKNPKVRRVTVIEKNPDVIHLIAPHMPKGVHIEEGDVFNWEPKSTDLPFHSVWMDIWSTLSEDNLEQMKQLRMRYRKWTEDKKASSVECWGREWLMMKREQERGRLW